MAARPSSAPDLSRVSVPNLNKDPIQSLQPWPVELSLTGQEFVIPALSAADWLTVLMVENLDLADVFPGMVEESGAVEDLIMSGALDIDEMEQVVLGIIEVISARQWWVALRLVEMARGSWDVIGAELLLKGVDATRISLSGWLDVVLLVALRSMDPKDVQMFTMKLESPPPSTKVEETDMEISVSQFMTMAS